MYRRVLGIQTRLMFDTRPTPPVDKPPLSALDGSFNSFDQRTHDRMATVSQLRDQAVGLVGLDGGADAYHHLIETMTKRFDYPTIEEPLQRRIGFTDAVGQTQNFDHKAQVHTKILSLSHFMFTKVIRN